MKIVILDGKTTNYGDISWGPIEELGELTIYDNTPQELITERAKSAQAVILNRCALTREIFDALPELRFVGMLATGYNAIDIAAAREKGIAVCNVPDYCGEMVAQHAITLLLTLCGNTHVYSEKVRGGDWNGAIELNSSPKALYELSGKTMGILGFGSIGRKVAEIAHALGMKVNIYSRTRKEAPDYCKWVELETLFSESDVVSLHCPLNDGTRHLVDEKLISLMKPTSFLINTARGAVVDSQALADALTSGRIAGAGIDVLETEPPKDDDPLLTAKNCYITPHIAWASKEARIRLVQEVADNLKAFIDGKPIHVVN